MEQAETVETPGADHGGWERHGHHPPREAPLDRLGLLRIEEARARHAVRGECADLRGHDVYLGMALQIGDLACESLGEGAAIALRDGDVFAAGKAQRDSARFCNAAVFP